MANRDRLESAAVAQRLTQLDGWSEREGRLHRELKFGAFADAFAFMTRVALAADRMDHHPDWFNSYTSVVIDLSSHDVGGISERDFELAGVVDAAARALGAGR